MAAPLPGFSEHPAVLDVEIGHRLGLRWFHLDETRHGHITVDHRIDQPVTLTCSCGDVITPSPDEVDPWWQRHNTRTTELTLKGVRDRWQPGENVAKCLATFDPYADRDYVSHGIPDEECGCGFWAYWNLGKQYVNPPTVAAIVKGYGDIIEGDLGFRCSHAQITALAPSVYSDALALTLETTWGVPVYSSVNAMLADSRNTPPQGQPALNGPELDNLAVLRRKRLAAWETCKAMADQAARKNRDFTPAERDAWDALNDVMEGCDRRIAALLPARPTYKPPTVSRGSGGNSTFHGLGGSPSGTWHPGGNVTYVTGGGGGGVVPTATTYVPSMPTAEVAAWIKRVTGKT